MTKNKIVIMLVSVVIVVFAVIFSIVSNINNVNNSNNINLSSIKSIVEDMGSIYIKEIKSSNNEFTKDIYIKFEYLPIENDIIYEKYYTDMASYIAEALDYNNYVIKDEENNLEIKVKCNKKDKKINTFMVNDNSNYFAELSSKKEVASYTPTKMSNINITSDEIKNLINVEWDTSKLNFGTRESTVDSYDIYFEEGIKVKKTGTKMYNIIFTNKYKKNVVESLNPTSSFDEVVSILGKPTFGSINEGLIGYKTEQIYVFFTEQEVSVYRVDSNNSSLVQSAIDYYRQNNVSYLAIPNYIYESDFDGECNKHRILPNNGIIIQYALKGIDISVGGSKKDGIYVYNNYYGDIVDGKNFEELSKDSNGANLELIHLVNSDLVYETEKERIHKYIFDYTTGMVTKNYGLFFESSYSAYDDSYSIDCLNIISINDNYPDYMIEGQVKTPIIIDDNRFVYAIQGDGIYLFDITKGFSKQLLSNEKDKLQLKEYDSKTKILKYDNKQIVIK